MFLSSPNRFQMFSSRFRLISAQKIYVPVFLGITSNDRLSRTNIYDHKLSKSRQKLISTHRAPLSWMFYVHSQSTVYVYLYINAPFHLRIQLACMVFFKRELCQFLRNIPVFIQWDREEFVQRRRSLFLISPYDFKVGRRSNENASKVNLWSPSACSI